MRYFSVIRASEKQGPPSQSLMDAMGPYVEKSLKSGVVVSTGGLGPSSETIRVAIRGGRIVVTDGPFAEAKEVIGGYAVLHGETREAVIASAREFMQLHLDHWPGWEGECELRELKFLAP